MGFLSFDINVDASVSVSVSVNVSVNVNVDASVSVLSISRKIVRSRLLLSRPWEKKWFAVRDLLVVGEI
jgi:hypothetical protein